MKQILKLGLKCFFIAKIVYFSLIYSLYIILDIENNLDAKSLVNASLGKDIIFVFSYLICVIMFYVFLRKNKKAIGVKYFVSVLIILIFHYFLDFRDLINLVAGGLNYTTKIIVALLISIIGFYSVSKFITTEET